MRQSPRRNEVINTISTERRLNRRSRGGEKCNGTYIALERQCSVHREPHAPDAACGNVKPDSRRPIPTAVGQPVNLRPTFAGCSHVRDDVVSSLAVSAAFLDHVARASYYHLFLLAGGNETLSIAILSSPPKAQPCSEVPSSFLALSYTHQASNPESLVGAVLSCMDHLVLPTMPKEV